MAEEIKWIKITTGIFDNRKIKQIDALPDCDRILVIWFKLLCLAGAVNERGLLLLTDSIPYQEETLASEFKRPLNSVRLALSTFQKLGMVEIDADIIHIKNWAKYQNIEGMDKIRDQAKKRMAKMRANRKLLPAGTGDHCGVGYVTSDATVTHGYATELELEKELEKETTGLVSPVDNGKVLAQLAKIIGPDAAQRWILDRGPDYCAAQLELLGRQGENIRNPRQWLLRALQGNWVHWQSPAPPALRPDPSCPLCGGRGYITDFTSNKTQPCSCVLLRPVAQAVTVTESAALVSDHDPAALAAALAQTLKV